MRRGSRDSTGRERTLRAKAAGDAAGGLMTSPAVTVQPEQSIVQDGIVTLSGELQQHSSIPVAIRLTRGVDGVVDVVNRLSFAIDDRSHRSQTRHQRL